MAEIVQKMTGGKEEVLQQPEAVDQSNSTQQCTGDAEEAPDSQKKNQQQWYEGLESFWGGSLLASKKEKTSVKSITSRVSNLGNQLTELIPFELDITSQKRPPRSSRTSTFEFDPNQSAEIDPKHLPDNQTLEEFKKEIEEEKEQPKIEESPFTPLAEAAESDKKE